MVEMMAAVRSHHDQYSVLGQIAALMGKKSFRNPSENAKLPVDSVRTDLSKFSDPETCRLRASLVKSARSFVSCSVGKWDTLGSGADLIRWRVSFRRSRAAAR